TSGTSGTTTQSRGVEISENSPPLRTELSSGSSSVPSKIWAKYADNQPVKIAFDGEDVHDLKKAIMKELPNQLGGIDT
ncbi:7025_t:CDS:2, partial [Acaulospora colombiana]